MAAIFARETQDFASLQACATIIIYGKRHHISIMASLLACLAVPVDECEEAFHSLSLGYVFLHTLLAAV